MRVSIAVALTGVALIGLAACNNAAPTAGNTTAASAAPPASGPINTAQLPHRKPGLWRQVMSMDGTTMPGPGMQLCVDEASEARMSAFAQRMPGGVTCPLGQFTRDLDGSV